MLRILQMMLSIAGQDIVVMQDTPFSEANEMVHESIYGSAKGLIVSVGQTRFDLHPCPEQQICTRQEHVASYPHGQPHSSGTAISTLQKPSSCMLPSTKRWAGMLGRRHVRIQFEHS